MLPRRTGFALASRAALYGRRRVAIGDVNASLTCVLCGGYFIDATTIVECLHSFCKSCIVRYLELSNYCPVCDVLVHKTRPHVNLRPDHTLQDLVYKLVPGLFTRELNLRREFLRKYAEKEGAISLQPTPDKRALLPHSDDSAASGQNLYVEDDKISLVLELSPDGKPVIDYLQDEQDVSKFPGRRYLLCPARFTVGLIKKFICNKFNISKPLMIDVFHTEEALADDYTLMDVAYIYTWQRTGPLRLFYSIYEPTRPLISLTADTAVPGETGPSFLSGGAMSADSGSLHGSLMAASVYSPRPTSPSLPSSSDDDSDPDYSPSKPPPDDVWKKPAPPRRPSPQFGPFVRFQPLNLPTYNRTISPRKRRPLPSSFTEKYGIPAKRVKREIRPWLKRAQAREKAAARDGDGPQEGAKKGQEEVKKEGEKGPSSNKQVEEVKKVEEDDDSDIEIIEVKQEKSATPTATATTTTKKQTTNSNVPKKVKKETSPIPKPTTSAKQPPLPASSSVVKQETNKTPPRPPPVDAIKEEANTPGSVDLNTSNSSTTSSSSSSSRSSGDCSSTCCFGSSSTSSDDQSRRPVKRRALLPLSRVKRSPSSERSTTDGADPMSSPATSGRGSSSSFLSSSMSSPGSTSDSSGYYPVIRSLPVSINFQKARVKIRALSRLSQEQRANLVRATSPVKLATEPSPRGNHKRIPETPASKTNGSANTPQTILIVKKEPEIDPNNNNNPTSDKTQRQPSAESTGKTGQGSRSPEDVKPPVSSLERLLTNPASSKGARMAPVPATADKRHF